MSLSSWHIWTNECEAINLQIKQGWIKIHVVSNDVYIEVAPVKPHKWSTQSTLTMTPVFQKPPIFWSVHI